MIEENIQEVIIECAQTFIEMKLKTLPKLNTEEDFRQSLKIFKEINTCNQVIQRSKRILKKTNVKNKKRSDDN